MELRTLESMIRCWSRVRLHVERGLTSLFKRPSLSASSGLIPNWPIRCSAFRAVGVCVLLSRSALAIGESSPIASEEPPRVETSAGNTGEVPDDLSDEASPIQQEHPAPLTVPSGDSAEEPGSPSGSPEVPSTTRNSARNFEAARGNMDDAPGVEEQKELPPPRKPPFHFMSPFTNLGHAWTSAERSIADCGDCSSQSLDLADGGFLEPGLAIGWPLRPAGVDFRGSFRQYFGEAAMANELRIGFALMLF